MNPKKMRFINSTWMLYLLLNCLSYPAFAQEENSTEPSPSQELVLSIQYGKGGNIQEFRVKSGETVFVQTGRPQSPTAQANPQQTKEMDGYQKQRGDIAQKIADKITAIQQKQQEFDTEVYPAYKAPIGAEVKALERDLKLLEAQREQLESQQIAKESQKASQPPLPASTVAASGVTVQPTITGSSASLTIQSQDNEATTTTIQAPINAWVQVFSAEKGQGQDIWAKIAPLRE